MSTVTRFLVVFCVAAGACASEPDAAPTSVAAPSAQTSGGDEAAAVEAAPEEPEQLTAVELKPPQSHAVDDALAVRECPELFAEGLRGEWFEIDGERYHVDDVGRPDRFHSSDARVLRQAERASYGKRSTLQR